MDHTTTIALSRFSATVLHSLLRSVLDCRLSDPFGRIGRDIRRSDSPRSQISQNLNNCISTFDCEAELQPAEPDSSGMVALKNAHFLPSVIAFVVMTPLAVRRTAKSLSPGTGTTKAQRAITQTFHASVGLHKFTLVSRLRLTTYLAL
ncbi:hypothetical protein E4U34_005906 [Claviceps purpurea]|nr:hypothetical protein E4U34_005906 [Claviceps purpurea]